MRGLAFWSRGPRVAVHSSHNACHRNLTRKGAWVGPPFWVTVPASQAARREVDDRLMSSPVGRGGQGAVRQLVKSLCVVSTAAKQQDASSPCDCAASILYPRLSRLYRAVICRRPAET